MNPTKTTYPIHERFKSFQGEGFHTGRPAFFIRTFGCPIQCPWCDSAGTWHPRWAPKQVKRMAVETLVEEALRADVAFVVITGGEPTIFDLSPLLTELQAAGLPVHLETSGAFKINGLFDWITLSPKKWREPLPQNIMLANEFKVIVETAADVSLYYDMLCRLGLPEPFKCPVWLHPEWGHRKDPAVLAAIAKMIAANLGNIRAGYQIHKLYRADALDSRSMIPVPLGGDPTKGL